MGNKAQMENPKKKVEIMSKKMFSVMSMNMNPTTLTVAVIALINRINLNLKVCLRTWLQIMQPIRAPKKTDIAI